VYSKDYLPAVQLMPQLTSFVKRFPSLSPLINISYALAQHCCHSFGKVSGHTLSTIAPLTSLTPTVCLNWFFIHFDITDEYQ